jgi:hypothetical protein
LYAEVAVIFEIMKKEISWREKGKRIGNSNWGGGFDQSKLQSCMEISQENSMINLC